MKSLLIFAIITLSFSPVLSQECLNNPDYAITFGITDNFKLTNFNMDIAVKKIIDEKHQLRLFLSPSVLTNKSDNIRNSFEGKIETIFETVSISLGIGADYLWTIKTNDDINMFSGTGVIISYGVLTNKTTNITPDNNKLINEVKKPNYSFGIRGTIGVEWKVKKNIGLHSEYMLGASYQREKSEDSSNSENKTDIFSLKSWVLFGVSIYF